MRQGNMSQL